MSNTKKKIHSIQVYIEDTDAAGIVYHPNYLKFCERARTEMLRSCGLTKTNIEKDHGLKFVIKDTSMQFIAPSYLDDLLCVHTSIDDFTPTRLFFQQEIYRSDKLLTSATITVVCINNNYKPAKLPAELFEKLELK